ncbi:MAG: glycoside hydrolase family 27 protein [Terracidiphilus sp.]|nr:glycoside hydrolase family 27 protein [Terracidiphilus sp.]
MRALKATLSALAVALFFANTLCFAQTGQTALTPPMGWSSWNYFGMKVTEQDIRNAADQIVASGMRDAGYVYVNIDDTWEGTRDANGELHSNQKFPDMKALADYLHSKGLKLGLYSGPGSLTCGHYAASLNHEEQDAKVFAAWGVDYLKYDLCSFHREVMQAQAPNDKAQQMRLMTAAYDKMGKALNATGRPIVYSLCQYGWDSVWEWGPSVRANMWRTGGDIRPNWQNIYTIIGQQAGLAKYAGPGHWNDPDMLEVGNGNLTLAENRAHFSMWAMLASPLIAGNDLPHMSADIRKILLNRDVIAIDQDRLGKEAQRIYTDGQIEIWARPLSGGARAIAVLNLGPDRVSTHPFHLSLSNLGLHGVQTAKNLWTGENVVLKDGMPVEIGEHDIFIVKISHPK